MVDSQKVEHVVLEFRFMCQKCETIHIVTTIISNILNNYIEDGNHKYYSHGYLRYFYQIDRTVVSTGSFVNVIISEVAPHYD